MNWLKSMLEEKPGVVSAARVILLLTFITCILAPISLQLYLAFTKGAWAPMDPTSAEYFKWAFTASLGGKISQAIWGEKDTPPSQ